MSEGDKNKKIIDGIEYQLNQHNEWCSYNKRKQLHSYNDKPAIISSYSSKYWYKNENLHRDNDKPAVIRADGSKEWCKNGFRHRDNDKPAVIYSDGTKEWWVNGRRQLNKYYVCVYIKRNKQFKEFFKTESQAKQYESDMLSNNLCAWVEENI